MTTGEIIRLSLYILSLGGMTVGFIVLWKIFGKSIKSVLAKNKKEKESKKEPKIFKKGKKAKEVSINAPEEIELTTIETKAEGLSLGDWRNVK